MKVEHKYIVCTFPISVPIRAHLYISVSLRVPPYIKFSIIAPLASVIRITKWCSSRMEAGRQSRPE